MLEPTEPVSDPTEGSAHDTPSDTLPPRRRRRAASRPAGPPVAGAEAAAVAETTAPAIPAAEAEEIEQHVEEAAAAEAPAPRTRRRATRRASAPAGAPAKAAEAVVDEPAVTAVSAPTAEESGEKGEESAAVEAPAVEEAAPAPRARRRATRRVSAPAAEAAPEAAAPEAPAPVEEAPAKAAEPEVEAKPETEAVAEDASPRRGRRRVTRKAAVGFSAPAPAVKNGDSEGGRRPARPAVAVFQAPVFAEPMFQTPERAAAAAAAEAAEDVVETEEEVVEAAPVAETVVEEQTPRRRRRRRGGDEEPVAAAPVVVAEPEETEGVDDAYESAEDSADVDDDGEEEGPGSRRRRRRGGRRRRRGESAEASGDEDSEDSDEPAAGQSQDDDGAEQDDEDDEDARSDESGGSSSSRRRRRRRRRAGDSSADTEPDDGDPERTVVKVREPRPVRERVSEPSDEVQSIKGSTRLEAKKQRRREGREQGRRRVPIITEAEFLARREAVERVMVVRQSGERTQIGVLEDGVLVEHYVNKEQSTSYVGNVYLGKVQNVLPSMEAAFIDIGKGRNAVLYAGEVNFEALGMANGPRRIESALKSGQSVLVQVTKDPIGHKGARLTSQVSLPGRYLVYVPEGSMTGISRKLPDTERARLKTILKKIVPEDAGVIVRTAAEGASEDELRRDVERLQAQWEDIQKKAKSGNAPTLLYGEPDMTVRVVRDIFNEDFSKVIVSGDEGWETIHGYVSHVAPDLADRLSKWTSEVDVFATYRIDEQLAKALDRKVWLPSGGSLVIDRTEAMVVVDVNTGKFTGQGGNLEETVTRNNLEAAEEIVRQLRLRDLGGIIVIDFIDMVLESNR
ncbi:MAG: Rne/Rng family ribonuclease, partial [Streptomyces turgidiscabies]|nr:Rne/Rng family ribonuclease [Streptomyces turgidiscabies]